MAVGVVMPKAGITVEECMITKWEKKVGDAVKVGEILFSYETDKAIFECESTAEGELLAIFFEEGDEVPVLVNVCAVGTAGDDITALRPDGANVSVEATPTAVGSADTAITDESPVVDSSIALSSGRIKISPRAKNLAEKAGVNPLFAEASGPSGRVIERDIHSIIESGKGATKAVVEEAAAGSGTGIGGRVRVEDLSVTPPAEQKPEIVDNADNGEYTDIKFSKIRSAIAQSMSTSLLNSAQLTHHHSFDATNILALRKGIKENADRLQLANITLNDFILFAVSRTLPNHPDLNAHVVDGNVLRRFKDVHLGVAVDTPRGLMVPTIFFANRKSLSEIAIEAKDLAKQAQAGTINPDLLQGGTFTVSNLGALGVEMFTPVLNPPQTGILGVCNIVNRLKEVGGEYKPYPAMGLSITYDHRAVDGAPEARFAQELMSNLENFSILLIK
ncbi:MAG TPA: dihydrolipoamide acetyltransferase family protein [Clostridia bacterium]|nr:dihydrolipoamide acetyltransferase family protein [Clostridia bacterium]